MEVSTSSSGSDQADEIRQALLLKRAIKVQENEQLALIEAVKVSGPSNPLDTGLVGRLLNEKA